MTHTVCRIVIALSSLLFAQASWLHAQGSLREQTRSIRGGTPERILAVNPFLPLAGYVQGEFEQRVADNTSLAIAGSYVPFNERAYQNPDVKLPLYPSARARQGPAIAAGGGVGLSRIPH